MEVDETEPGSSSASGRRSSQQRKLTYRQLLNKVEELTEAGNDGIEAANLLREVLRETNQLETEVKIDDRIQNADETILDSFVLSSASSLLKTYVGAVDVYQSSYEPLEFANRIIQNLLRANGTEDEDFDPVDLLNLLPDARDLIPQLPDYRFVYGAYDLENLPEPKVRKVRQRQAKENVQKKLPEKVVDRDKEEEGIEEIVKVLYDVLSEKYAENDEEPVQYYDYIIDDSSFTETVENAFYFSFLVRDGRALISLDKNNKPIIKPTKKKELKSFRDDGGANAQVVTALSMKEWRKYKNEGFLQQNKKTNRNRRNNK